MSLLSRKPKVANPPPMWEKAGASPQESNAVVPQAIVRAVMAAAADARKDVRDRITEVNAVTEREVVAAAENVNAIVEHTTTTVGCLKQMAATFEGNAGQDGVARAIDAQTAMVRAFVDELVELARAQAQATIDAQKTLAELGKATRAIDTLASEAKILALNSRIEAGRAGGQNHAFSVVSDEMRRLSAAVAVTNTKVRDLSTTVGSALARVVQQSQNTRSRIERFASESDAGTREVLGQVSSFRQETKAALDDSDDRMDAAVRSSHATLSNLQFQDVICQGLLRLDGRMRELQVQLATAVGAPQEATHLPAPAHREVGGDKTVENKTSGDVFML
jgi:methyl-accepting chemotaxis protein